MKTSQNTKRQHTVPRVYLKNFGETSKKETFIYALDKNIEGSKPFRTNIINVCVETDYYTFDSLPDNKKRILEDFFSKNIEDYYDDIYRILIDPKIEEINEEIRYKIISFCISQFFRTPKLSRHFNKFWKKIIDTSFSMADANPDIKKIKLGNKEIDPSIINKEDFIKLEIQKNKELINKFSIERIADFTIKRINDGISVKRIHEKHKLITSDNPVFPSEHINLPDSFIRIPIDENHLLMLIPENQFNNRNISRQTFDEEWSYIETVSNNIKQYESAERFILGTKEGINNFINHLETYDKEDFTNRVFRLKTRIANMTKFFEQYNKK